MRRADTHVVNAQRSTLEDLTLETGQLRLAYQPVIELETGRMSGFEALLRCECVLGETIAPGPLVQIAEETGLIVPIGGWILREACKRAASVGAPLHVGVRSLRIRERLGVPACFA